TRFSRDWSSDVCSSDLGMTDGQFAVLVNLHRHGPHTLSALADRDGVTAPSMNRTVNALEEAGYVTRVADADDRRRVRIAITDAGDRKSVVEVERVGHSG